MDKLIPISILAAIIVIGFFSKVKTLSTIDDRIKFTSDYQEKLYDLIKKMIPDKEKKFVDKNYFDEDLYNELIRHEGKMNAELAYGFATTPLYYLLNEIFEMVYSSWLSREDISLESIKRCDNMFIQHLETLENQKENIRKRLFNPFSSLAAGIKVIILSPLILLRWFGFVPIEKIDRAKNNMLVKMLNAILSLLSLAGTIISIVVGWNDFWNMVFKLFK